MSAVCQRECACARPTGRPPAPDRFREDELTHAQPTARRSVSQPASERASACAVSSRSERRSGRSYACASGARRVGALETGRALVRMRGRLCVPQRSQDHRRRGDACAEGPGVGTARGRGRGGGCGAFEPVERARVGGCRVWMGIAGRPQAGTRVAGGVCVCTSLYYMYLSLSICVLMATPSCLTGGPSHCPVRMQ